MSLPTGERVNSDFEPRLASTIERILSLGKLPSARAELLSPAVEAIVALRCQAQCPRLVFICTHNSRRSQFGQAWATIAASWFGVVGIESYSGGTEVTQCHRNVIESLSRAGCQGTLGGGVNARHTLRFSAAAPLVLYSKRFDAPEIPRENLLAMMCCHEADGQCPTLLGAVARIALHYEDPKRSDDTDRASAVYDERRDQIAQEMLYLMSRVANRLK